MPVMSCRRVIATSVLFLLGWLFRRSLQSFAMRAVRGDSSDPGLFAALKSL
jgi:hypothetical protein